MRGRIWVVEVKRKKQEFQAQEYNTSDNRTVGNGSRRY